jgi:glycosyltransferase involved in cell wall biosynthesis
MEFGDYPSVVDVVVDKKLPYFIKSFESLLKQTVQDFEFVLVIGHPGDAVREYLATQSPEFTVVSIQEPPRDKYPARAAANNLGLDAATGNVYIGTQDDMIYPKNWVESHIEWHKKPDGPWFVYNRIKYEDLGDDDRLGEEFWVNASNPRNIPIVSRWQHASGHSFSLPMWVAKQLRHDEDFCSFWGFEDLEVSYQAHRFGCKFIMDIDVTPAHQNHNDLPQDIWNRSEDAFWDWLGQRSRNRRLFYEKWGFEPETGIINDGFGLGGEFDLDAA